MERHPDIGHRIIGPIPGLALTTLHCVRHHHERWDGSGYPQGLAGEAIPLGARIVSVVDVWDGLSTERPYKRAFSPAEVRALLEKGRGSQFDPALLDLFFQILEEEGPSLEVMLASPPGGES
jgi:putative two-component system response regulator